MSIRTVKCTLTPRRPGTEKENPSGADPRKPGSVPSGRVPRIARLMALALRFEQLVRTGAVRDYAELARLGQVSRARLTQIMNLLHLAPDIQEAILFLPRVLWTQLRHDTILYIKQSMTGVPSCSYPAGYVEPVPLFWERLDVMYRSRLVGHFPCLQEQSFHILPGCVRHDRILRFQGEQTHTPSL